MTKKMETTKDAYGKALVDLGAELSNVVVLDADLSCSTKTSMFRKAYPDRFVNCGVAEQDMIGMAAGLAASGKIAFASTFAVFGSGRAWDQVRASVAYPRLNVKIVVTHGGITVGEDGPTHQALEDIAIMRALPNMIVIVPSDSIETYNAVKAASKYFGPVYMRLGRPAVPVVSDTVPAAFEIGKSIMFRDGRDLSIIACGIMVSAAIDAAQELAKENISARVINMHTIKPMDKEAVLKAASETGAIVTAEEHSGIGGLGSAVSEITSEEFPVPVVKVGVDDTFAESGKPDELLERYGLTAREIAAAAKKALALKKKR